MIGRVEVETRDRVVVAKLLGEVDLSNVDEISSSITEMISPETARPRPRSDCDDLP